MSLRRFTGLVALLVALVLLGALATASVLPALANSRTRESRLVLVRAMRVAASRGGVVRVTPRVRLWIPRRALRRDAVVTIYRFGRAGYTFRINRAWHGHLFLRVRGAQRYFVTRPLGGIYSESSSRSARLAGRGVVSFLLEAGGEVCMDTAQDEPETFEDPYWAAGCLIVLAAQQKEPASAAAVTYEDAEEIAAEVSPACVAHIQTLQGLSYVPILTFQDPACKTITEPQGPSDGTPLVVATLTVPKTTGIPLGTTTSPPTTSTATPPPPPPPPTQATVTVTRGGAPSSDCGGASSCYFIATTTAGFSASVTCQITQSYYGLDGFVDWSQGANASSDGPDAQENQSVTVQCSGGGETVSGTGSW